jgi:hypothetical protein
MKKIARLGIVLLVALFVLWAAEKGIMQIVHYFMRDAEF